MRGRDIAVALITARETAKQVAKELVKPVTVVVQPIQPKITIINSDKNISVGTFKELLDRKGEGELKDILIITSSSSYKLRVLRDNESLYDSQYSDFQELSNMIDDIEAHPEVDEDGAETGRYMLGLKRVSFSKRIRVLIEPNIPLTITTLYYEISITKSDTNE